MAVRFSDFYSEADIPLLTDEEVMCVVTGNFIDAWYARREVIEYARSRLLVYYHRDRPWYDWQSSVQRVNDRDVRSWFSLNGPRWT